MIPESRDTIKLKFLFYTEFVQSLVKVK